MSILSNCVHKIYVTATYSGNANEWLYTNCFVTIPANSFFVATATTTYSRSSVKAIRIDTNASAGGYAGSVTEFFGSVTTTYADFTQNGTTLYVKAMIGSNLGSYVNPASLTGFYITLPNY